MKSLELQTRKNVARGGPGARPPNRNVVFMFKIHYFSSVTNFQKLPSAGGSSPTERLNFQYY